MDAGATVAALASPPGEGARAVLRVSGPRAAELVAGVWACESPTPTARGVYAGRFGDGRGTQPMLLVWMPGPGSYTREDVAEFHLPGAPPLAAVALERLLALGAASAPPGEFTRRAFLNGRLDLTRAEGVLALVEARSEAERRAATLLLSGGLADRVDGLREDLDALRALCEASLDFDETDTGHVPDAELDAGAGAARCGLADALAWETAREPERGLPQVVLVGAPNAGKSLLFNRLAGGEALVSRVPGTTRDALRAEWSLGEGAVLLWDTAGVEEAGGAVEREAQAAARALRESADLRLWVVDARRPLGELRAEREALGGGAGRFLVWNRIDQPGAAPDPPEELARGLLGAAAVSAATGAGTDGLAGAVDRALGLSGSGGGEVRELSARHREALSKALAALDAGLAERRAGAPLDLFAEALRRATAALDRILGRTTPEDLLDRVFAAFCIGK